MASADDVPPVRQRAGFWLVLVGAVSCGLIGVGFVTWRWLPTWAPNWVLAFSPWMEPALRAAMHQGNYRINPVFVKRLEAWGDSGAPALIAALRSSEYGMRLLAAKCIRINKTPSAVPALIVALDDNDESVRIECAYALREIGDHTALIPLRERLLRCSDQNNVFAASAAAEAIAKLGDPHLIDLMLPLLSSENEIQRGLACLALYLHDDVRTVAVVAPLLGRSSFLKDNSFDGAAYALGHCRRPEAVAAIAAALSSSEPRTRASAIYAASRHAHATLLPTLLTMINDPENIVRNALALTLAKYHQPEALVGIAALIDGGGPSAVRLVRNVSPKDHVGSIDLLLARLAHPEAAVRIAVLNKLVDNSNPAMVESLLAVLDDPDQDVRQCLFKNLSRLFLTPEQKARVDRARNPAVTPTPSPTAP